MGFGVDVDQDKQLIILMGGFVSKLLTAGVPETLESSSCVNTENVTLDVNLDSLGLESKTLSDTLENTELGSLGTKVFTSCAQSGLEGNSSLLLTCGEPSKIKCNQNDFCTPDPICSKYSDCQLVGNKWQSFVEDEQTIQNGRNSEDWRSWTVLMRSVLSCYVKWNYKILMKKWRYKIRISCNWKKLL